MGEYDKILQKVLRGDSDSNLSFEDLCGLLDHLGFGCRVRGDHHIYFKDDVAEILNLQPRQGKAKAYQVKQVRGVILRYRLQEASDEQV